jgi:uncharacterized surface protein with fasciclin (FAS1) repeats
MKYSKIIGVVILNLAFLQACSDDNNNNESAMVDDYEAMTIVDVASGNGSFTILTSALQSTGLDAVLADAETNYTVFAPTDAAFAKLPEGTLESLTTEQLSDILLYHVLAGNVMAETAISVAQSMDNKVATANGGDIALSYSDSMLYVNSAKVSTADIMASNGVIHVVDTVILPESIIDASEQTIVEVALADPDNFSTLVDALIVADLVTILSDETATFTVFAPTNSAFDKIEQATLDALLADTTALSNLLLTHVVSGTALSSLDAYAANGKMISTASGTDISVNIDAESGMLKIGNATVSITNINTSNGTIHVIDDVILE